MSKGISQTVVRKPKYKEVSKAFDIAIERVMLVATQEVKNKAQVSIQSHQSSGRTYTRYPRPPMYKPRRTHTASTKGNPPNTDTGFLANNIFSRVNRFTNEGEVAATAEYAKFLEDTSKLDRPFLAPALKDSQDKIERLFARLRIKI